MYRFVYVLYVYNIIICCKRERDGQTDGLRRGDRPFHRWLMINRIGFSNECSVSVCCAPQKKKKKKKRRRNPFLLLVSPRRRRPLIPRAHCPNDLLLCRAHEHTHASHDTAHNTTRKRRGVGMSNNTNSIYGPHNACIVSSSAADNPARRPKKYC